MKHITFLMLSLFLLTQTVSNAQEGTKIPFDKGVLKICSSKNFIIKGYDGKDVIIKNLHKNIEGNLLYTTTDLRNKLASVSYRPDSVSRSFPSFKYAKLRNTRVVDSSRGNYVLFTNKSREQSKGLKKLGKKATAKESGIYLKIEQKDGELIIKDDTKNSLIITREERYEITIPNTLKLKWNTNDCNINISRFFGSNPCEINNFEGEVEVSSSLNNFNFKDVSGPVSINTIGGNVTIIFDKIIPKHLYSIYSNNGFIDITLPKSANLSVDATASEILSDLDFTVLSEKDNVRTQQMSLKLGTGKVKMKLDADLGNIYLRKQ